jgi:nitrogen-specific signal transduction histidine kinase
MHKRARGLNLSFEKIIVAAVAIEPNLLQNVVRFVVTLLVPEAKERAIKRVVRHVAGKIDSVAFELAHKLRNPLAFAHGGLNFIEPQMMGKPTFPEGHDSSPRRVRPLADIRDRNQE